MKALKNIKSKLLGIVTIVALFALVGLAYSAIEKKKEKRIKAIVISIDDYHERSLLTPADMKNYLIQHFDENLVSRRVSELDLMMVESILTENEMVKNARVYIDAQNKLHAEVWTKKPLYRVYATDFASKYVDSEGKMFSTSRKHVVKVPIITGSTEWIFDERPNSRKADFHDFMRYIEKDKFLSSLIEQVDIERDGDLVLATKLSNAEVVMGDLDNYQDKLIRLEKYYKKTVQKIGLSKFDSISLKYEGQVVCKLKEKNKT